jgi:TPR repeat protein
MRNVPLALAIGFVVWSTPGLARDSLTRPCDIATASPTDRTRPADIAGVDVSKIDTKVALPACQAALNAAPDDARLLFQMGLIFEHLKDYSKALSYYEKAIAHGHAEAQARLGCLYAAGQGGLAENKQEAVRLYKMAADQGNAFGQAGLGAAYQLGAGGLPKDEGQAARLYKLAADQGYALAQAGLGAFYLDGRGGLPKNEREAARLFKLAVDQGIALAEFLLGAFYRNGRGGLPKDEGQAARLYKLAADQGNADGQVNLGAFYFDGRGGLLKNEREAARLFKLAADQGNADAEFLLGAFYLDGRGGLPKDEREAARLFKLATDQAEQMPSGERGALRFLLGTLYESGRGVLQDAAAAEELYLKAAADGNSDAQAKLAESQESSQPREGINLVCQGAKGKKFVSIDATRRYVKLQENRFTFEFIDGTKQYVRISDDAIEFGCLNAKTESEVLAEGFEWILGGGQKKSGWLTDLFCRSRYKLDRLSGVLTETVSGVLAGAYESADCSLVANRKKF